MKRIILFGLVAVLIMSLLGGCSEKSASSAEKDIEAQIENMLNMPEQEDENGLFGTIAANNRIFSDDEYGRKISEKVEYKIDAIEVDGECGTVKIKINSPDVYELLEDSASEFDSKEDLNEFLALVCEKLDGKYPEINETVECEIKFENGKWNLVVNSELLDALSGNLYSGYMSIANSFIESVEEE